MPDLKTDAIVLRAVNYRESDRMLTLLSPELGRVDAIARGCRKPTSRLLAASQPFALGEFLLSERSGRLSLRSAFIRESYFPIASDYDVYQNAVYCAEWCLKVIQPNQPSAELFSLLLTVLSHYAYGAGRPGRITAVFLVQLSMLLGITPATYHCASCGQALHGEARWLSVGGGGVCASCHPEARALSQETLDTLRVCLEGPMDLLMRLGLSDEPLREVRALMMRFLSDNL